MFSTTGFSLLTFLVLLGGIAVHIAKQFRIASVTKSGISLKSYLVDNWPETLTGLVGSLVFWVGLPEIVKMFPDFAATIHLGMEVGIFSSFLCGFIGNSVADLIGNRAASLTGAAGRLSGVGAEVRSQPAQSQNQDKG